MNARSLYYALPTRLRFLLRRLYYGPHDALTALTGRRHRYEPPKGRIFVGSGDFVEQGRQQLDLLRRYAGLRPDHVVLDVGCGIGRTAAALTTYLGRDGRYEGFDIVRSGIRWCQKTMGRDHPNFAFTWVDLGNDLYRQRPNDAAAFSFPYPDGHFDLIFLFSVFTHLQPTETARYLAEIRRTLKSGGKGLATFFVYDEETEARIAGPGPFAFPVDEGKYRLMNARVRSANVALREDHLRDLVRGSGLRVERFLPGTWKGATSEAEFFQDIVILEKTNLP